MPNQLARQEGNVQSVVTEARDIISRNPRPSRPPGPLLHGPSLETPNEHHQAPRVTLDIYARSSHGGRPHQERKAPATISTSSSDSEDLAVDQARGLKRRRLALRPKRHNVQTTPSAKVLYFFVTVSEVTVEPGQIPDKGTILHPGKLLRYPEFPWYPLAQSRAVSVHLLLALPASPTYADTASCLPTAHSSTKAGLPSGQLW